jgi:dihydrofolate reductase
MTMRLTVTEFLSLDGVSQGPGSPEEDTSDGFTQGGWLVPHMDGAFIRQASEWLGKADGLLLGRRTYDAFARDWPQITDPDDPFTVLMNSLPKYVASHTLTAGTWNPTTILSGDVASQVAELKQQPGRELQIHGSARLVQSLLAAGVIDELRLVVAPVIVGQGRRLFPDGGAPAGLRLLSSETTPGGLALQVYEWVGLPEHATYAGVSGIA